MEEVIKKILWKNKKLKVPVVLQIDQTECGAACLAMVLAYHKCFVPLEQLRVDCGVSRDGSNAFSVVKAARKYGFEARGFSISKKDITTIQLPAILLWNAKHFVVLEGRKGKSYYINDPEFGERTVTSAEFEQSFSRLALQITPGSNFKPEKESSSILISLLSYLIKSKSLFIYITICTILLAIPGIMVPALSMVFIDHVMNSNTDLLIPLVAAVAVFATMKAYVSWLLRTAVLKASSKFLVTNAAMLFEHVIRLPAEFYNLRTPGDIQYRLTLNRNISNFISGPAGEAFSSLIAAALFVTVMFRYDIPLATAGVVIVLLNILVLHVLNRRKQSQNQILAMKKNKIFRLSATVIKNIDSIKISSAEPEFFAKWTGLQAEKNNAEQKINSSNIYAGAIPELLTGLNITAVLILGSWRVINGDMSMGMLVAFQALMGAFIAPASALVMLGPQIQSAKENFRKISDMLKHKKDPVFERVKNHEDTGKLFLSGELELKNLTYGYSNSSPPLINDVSIHIKPGRKVGLTGSSGAGKSTIAKIASGLYKPWTGEVLLDGKPLTSYSRECIESSIAVVEQNPVFFTGSIRENISMWNPLKSDKQLSRAAINANIHHIILKRPEGYDSPMNENAQNFSGGEKQRIDIARALLNNPSLLILDEACSAIDNKNSKIIFDNIKTYGCSVLLITQQEELLKDCDEVVVIEDGRISSRGKYENIIRKAMDKS